MPAPGRDRLGPDRQALNIERVRALSLQHTPIDDHPGCAAPLADGEGCDDDIGDAAILLDRSLMANERKVLPLTVPMQPRLSQRRVASPDEAAAASRSSPSASSQLSTL
jgi:hypothetical protein